MSYQFHIAKIYAVIICDYFTVQRINPIFKSKNLLGYLKMLKSKHQDPKVQTVRYNFYCLPILVGKSAEYPVN